jgi:dimethylhistidine N-methyltransferase
MTISNEQYGYNNLSYEFVRFMTSPIVPLSTSKVKFYDLHPPLADFRAEVLQGLQQPEKTISPKFLYDKKGAELFEKICSLEEYYLTRTEIAILQKYAGEIADLIDGQVLIEFGSGGSQKVRFLLDRTEELPVYLALDISQQHLWESCQRLTEDYQELETIAICTDYTQPIILPEIEAIANKKYIAFFPGSSIGNLELQEAINFLKNTAELIGKGGGLIIGVDLKKDTTILEPAYRDGKGISAAFALNLLTRINRELKANFNVDNFSYDAVYNSDRGRIEMYIVSSIDQKVTIDDRDIIFRMGEKLRTEYSYKYSIDEFINLAGQAGFSSRTVWTDDRDLFSIHYLVVE